MSFRLRQNATLQAYDVCFVGHAIIGFCDRGEPFAVATVLKAEGSTPTKAGAKAIVEADGTIHGTIGGGKVEAETQRLAVQAIQAAAPLVFDFEMQGAAASGNTPICGGKMRVLVDPDAIRHRDAFAAAADAEERRVSGVLVTAVRAGSPTEVRVQFASEFRPL